ncbi:MAG: translocation/assembly module TamB domain-containing protein [Pseudomonadales bacterium]
MKRALVILIGALLLLLALAGSTLAFLALSDGGTRFLAEQAERFLPVRFVDVSGALLREVQIGRLEVDLEDRTLTIDGLELAVQFMPLLFENRLLVDRIRAGAVVLSGSSAPSDLTPPPPLELPFMPVEIDVADATVERLVLDQVFPIRVTASATWLRDGLTVRAVAFNSDVINGTVEGRLGNGGNPQLSASVTWSLPDEDWSGAGTLEGRVNEFRVQHTLRGLVSGEAEGTGSLADVSEPDVDLRVAVNDLVFGETAVRGIGGALSGTLANLSADVGARVETPGFEPFQARVQAYGPVAGPLTVRTVSADALGGTQRAQGTIAWNDGVRVRLGGSAENVSLQALWQQLSGSASALFQFGYENERLSLLLEDITGTLNERPVAGSLDIAQVGEGWVIDPLQISVGDNRITGSASIDGAALTLNADFDAPALEALDLGVAGDARGRVRVTGRWPDLNGTASLTGSRLEGFDVALADVKLDAAMDAGVLRGELQAGRVERGQVSAEAVDFEADGTLDDLRWRLNWADGRAAGTLRQIDDGFTVGLTTASVSIMQATWSLQSPTRVDLLGDRIDVAPACIAGGEASACVERFVYAGGEIDTQGELVRAPVQLLQPFVPLRLGGAGYLEGRWTLGGDPGDPRGELALAARSLTVVPATGEDPVALPDLETTGTVADGVLQMRLTATDEAFTITGEGRLEPLDAQGALTGTLRVAATDLAPLRAFDQRIEELGGAIEGSLDISGTPAAPRAQGRFRLNEGRLKLNDPDVTLTAVDVVLRLDDSGTFELEGSARQKKGDVRLTASGSGLFSNTLAAQAALVGNGLKARHPDWEITVSPDLTFTYADAKGRVRGKVEIPEAEVRLNTLPSSVPSPSEDVVVVGRESNGNGNGNWLRMDVDVVLGDDVALKALGISAELEGSLRARLDAQGRTTLRGTLNITGGVLAAQGQTLSIESGTVVYNGPVTRPYIDLRAVRLIDDVTPEVKVGLHIRGDANNLTSSVFSEPAMSETRALSFLVLGRDIDQQTANSDSSQLMAAAINLGLSRSKGITSELMRRTGLDELSAMAESQNSFAIVAGKRITDDLYVRYTYDTLSALGAFLVRYELTKRWQLEAQSGEQSAMDLMYSFDK